MGAGPGCCDICMGQLHGIDDRAEAAPAASFDSQAARQRRRSRCLRTTDCWLCNDGDVRRRTVIDHDPRVPADAVASCRRVAPSVARGRRKGTSRACSTDSSATYTYGDSDQASSRVCTGSKASSEPGYFRHCTVETSHGKVKAEAHTALSQI